jgi:hypothetical protein
LREWLGNLRNFSQIDKIDRIRRVLRERPAGNIASRSLSGQTKNILLPINLVEFTSGLSYGKKWEVHIPVGKLIDNRSSKSIGKVA